MTGNFDLFKPFMDPAELEQLKRYDSVSEMWADVLAKFGDRTAIDDEGKQYSFSELEARAAQLRGALRASGLARGDRVGLLAENSVDFVAGFLAVTTLGAAAAVLPAQLEARAVLGCSMMFGLRLLLSTPAKAADCALAQEKLGLPVVLTGTAGEPLPMEPCGGEEPCAIMFTGGTTGQSKGASLSNAAVMQGVFNGCLGYRGVFGQRYLLVLPLSHVFGLIRNLLTSLSTGSAMFICRNNKDMFRDVAVFKPTILVVVPALAEMALGLSRRFGRNMLGEDLRTIICGAAAVPPYLVTEYDKMGVSLYPGYGLTETANLVSGNPRNVEKPDSVGLPFPDQELRIVDGELWLKGRNLMDGYVGSEENAWTDDGWFRTGDLARFDDDGFLYITGRIKEVIILPNGENVSPAEVETAFLTCTLIQDCQVFEDLDGQRHILALEVVPRAAEMAKLPAEAAGAQLMRELETINASLPAYQRVSRITVRTSDFERTKSMKIVRYHKCK